MKESEDDRVKEGGGETSRKPGRPTNAERLGLERSHSLGAIPLTEFWKRKRAGDEDQGEGELVIEPEEEEKRIFGKSRKISRSPSKTTKDGDKRKVENKGPEGAEGEGGEELGERELVRITIEELKEEMGKIKKQNAEASREIRKIAEDLRKREKEWQRERTEWEEKVAELERRVEGMEKRETGKLGEKGGEKSIKGISVERDAVSRREEERKEKEKEKQGEEIGRKLREIEREIERKKREEIRNNVVIRGTEWENGKAKEKVQEIMKEIGARVDIREVKEAGGERRKVLIAKLGSREQKIEVMEKKKKLCGREERIEDDLTWEERRVKWTINEIAWKEKKKGNRASVGYGRLWVEGVVWRWDEAKKALVDITGRIRKNEEETDAEEEKEIEAEQEDGATRNGEEREVIDLEQEGSREERDSGQGQWTEVRGARRGGASGARGGESSGNLNRGRGVGRLYGS